VLADRGVDEFPSIESAMEDFGTDPSPNALRFPIAVLWRDPSPVPRRLPPVECEREPELEPFRADLMGLDGRGSGIAGFLNFSAAALAGRVGVDGMEMGRRAGRRDRVEAVDCPEPMELAEPIEEAGWWLLPATDDGGEKAWTSLLNATDCLF